jgi:predicted naringenin-chalcone synthase
LSKITSIATATPAYAHLQDNLFHFADNIFCKDAVESRKLRFLYRQSGIHTRYSVLPDFDKDFPAEENMFSAVNNVPTLEQRMQLFETEALALSVKAIEACIKGVINKKDITHLITVSCTGMSAPGLDLHIMEAMDLPLNIHRTSVNFMGCYAAIHALKMGDAFCNNNAKANIVIVCTELCTLHFQKEATPDNMMSSLLFADGSAAMLLQGNQQKGWRIDNFYAEVMPKGKNDMSWQLSHNGFLMTLSGYIPELVKQDFKNLVDKALSSAGLSVKDIDIWCIHPGGKKILEAIRESLDINAEDLEHSYEVLRKFGNMSSATIVFVLKEIWEQLKTKPAAGKNIFGAAFGPGLTMETFLLQYE